MEDVGDGGSTLSRLKQLRKIQLQNNTHKHSFSEIPRDSDYCDDEQTLNKVNDIPDQTCRLSDTARIGVAAILKGTLDRLAVLSIAPQAHDASSCDTSIKLDTLHGDNYEVTKSRLLEHAKIIQRPFASGPKLSKFKVEATWLQNALQSTLEEVENEATFSSLLKVIEGHETNEKRIPERIEHMKSLNAEMHVLRQAIHAEALAHKDVIHQLQRSLAELKLGIKDLKKQNKLTYKFRLDIAVATTDCHRRVREEHLKVLKDEIDQLSNDFEIEKRANFVSVEFLKKQNLQFMEEAIALAAAHDNDIQHMDIMLRKLRDQKQKKEELLSVLEPRYMGEMAQKKAAEEELQKQKNTSIEKQGEFEVTTRAAVKIQKMWRGNRIRLMYSKELKNIRKKKRACKSKGTKKKMK